MTRIAAAFRSDQEFPLLSPPKGSIRLSDLVDKLIADNGWVRSGEALYWPAPKDANRRVGDAVAVNDVIAKEASRLREKAVSLPEGLARAAILKSAVELEMATFDGTHVGTALEIVWPIVCGYLDRGSLRWFARPTAGHSDWQHIPSGQAKRYWCTDREGGVFEGPGKDILFDSYFLWTTANAVGEEDTLSTEKLRAFAQHLDDLSLKAEEDIQKYIDSPPVNESQEDDSNIKDLRNGVLNEVRAALIKINDQKEDGLAQMKRSRGNPGANWTPVFQSLVVEIIRRKFNSVSKLAEALVNENRRMSKDQGKKPVGSTSSAESFIGSQRLSDTVDRTSHAKAYQSLISAIHQEYIDPKKPR